MKDMRLLTGLGIITSISFVIFLLASLNNYPPIFYSTIIAISLMTAFSALTTAIASRVIFKKNKPYHIMNSAMISFMISLPLSVILGPLGAIAIASTIGTSFSFIMKKYRYADA